MINTDKYEGHTEGVWEEVHFNWKNYVVCIQNVADVVFVNDGGTTDANWNLIKDAPLLLAEVKKLREQLKEANDVIQYALEMSSDDDSTRVFEDYLEVIE
mgnify:CR=1 FL=1